MIGRLRNVSIRVRLMVKKESKKTPKPKQTKTKVTSSGSAKKSTTQKKSAVKVRNEATVPQSQKVRALSEKERKQRQDRRESYVKELALLKNKVTNWIIFDMLVLWSYRLAVQRVYFDTVSQISLPL